jgi:hypothetical protein
VKPADKNPASEARPTRCPRCQKYHPHPKGMKRKLCAVCVTKVSDERRETFVTPPPPTKGTT